MLTVASLLAAMTIAGAFWVGVLAARRLRDWGEGRRAIDEGHAPPLALAAASGAPPDDPTSRRVRELVAERLSNPRVRPGAIAPRQLVSADAGSRAELGLGTLRQGDVIVVEAADSGADGDYLAEGVVPSAAAPDMETAVRLATEMSRSGDAVLLSPACASFDMFDNFEQRGDIFRNTVHALWPSTITNAQGGHA